MTKPTLDTIAHYEHLANAFADPDQPKIGDPFHDPPGVAAWLAQADGPEFWDAVGSVEGQTVLEIGLGTGRVAAKMLQRDCAHLTGLEVSPKTLELARDNLAQDPRVGFLLQDVVDFIRPATYDLAYSVWTFFHIPDKPRALSNIVTSLKRGGRLVLSLERTPACLDHGTHLVQQYPVEPDQYLTWLQALDCDLDEPVTVPDRHSPDHETLTTILAARKR
ncbi:MAG: class I SAM-dependent methyltransferase [Armatimonadia bacterium]|nr:class I SAM-dependent methyltransferase [bacterium]